MDDSQTSESSDDHYDHLELLQHKDGRVKRMYREKLKMALTSYEGKDLNNVDKKLFNGLEKKKLQDDDQVLDLMMKGVKNKIFKELN